MGKNTYNSIGKPLPNRVNIVLSTDKQLQIPNCVVRSDLQQALDYCKRWGQQEVFIIGGAQVYSQAIDIAHKLYITRVDTQVQGADAFFPEIDSKKWSIVSAQSFCKDDENDYDHSFEVYDLAKGEPIIYA